MSALFGLDSSCRKCRHRKGRTVIMANNDISFFRRIPSKRTPELGKHPYLTPIEGVTKTYRER